MIRRTLWENIGGIGEDDASMYKYDFGLPPG